MESPLAALVDQRPDTRFGARLAEALPGLGPYVARARATAGVAGNDEGGDPGAHGDPRLLARHLGNYLLAAELVTEAWAGRPPARARLVDVGCGTGAFSAWLADRLDATLELVDHDPAVLGAAAAVAGGVRTHGSTDEVAPADVVTAMEVLEHVPPTGQAAFCAGLLAAVRPGGLLVLSTPDESLYPGGWSGYAPHVGVVTAGMLASLLLGAGAASVDVRRIVGGPFDTSPARRVGEAVGNRAWAAVRGRLPGLAERAVRTAGDDPAAGRRERRRAVPSLRAAHVLPAETGDGGSLLAVVRV